MHFLILNNPVVNFLARWEVMGGLALILIILIVVFFIMRNRREED